MTTIDSHQHFWTPSRGDYFWMPENDKILSRTYSIDDLKNEFKKTKVDHTVLVQAAPSNAETEYMLGIADSSEIISGVVGWINFEDPNQIKQLKKFSKHKKFVGVRPMIQDISDVNWMLKKDLNWAFDALIDMNLTFDALGYPKHLDNFFIVAEKHPSLKIVIDHFMKPKICENKPEEFDTWKLGMKKLSELKNVYCKLSGIVTEACENWKEGDLKPYAEHVFNIFGSEKIMWGSDWPVCRLRSEYNKWFNTAKNLTRKLGTKENEDIFGKTAIKFYNLNVD